MADLTNLRKLTVTGAVAGDIAVAGILAGDRLISVEAIDITLTEGAPNTRAWTHANLTAEFKVTADGTINNAAGTSTANKMVVVMWEVTGSGRETFNRQANSGRSTF